MMDLNEIGRFMGETQYKQEIAELALRYEGVNLIELGTSRNLARVYTEILGFTARRASGHDRRLPGSLGRLEHQDR